MGAKTCAGCYRMIAECGGKQLPACHFKRCDVSEYQLPDLDVWIEFYTVIQSPMFKESGAVSSILEKVGAFNDSTIDILAQMDCLKVQKQQEDLKNAR